MILSSLRRRLVIRSRKGELAMSDEITYPTLKQVERLYRRVIQMTGGEAVT
jgi:hypothetical protein